MLSWTRHIFWPADTLWQIWVTQNILIINIKKQYKVSTQDILQWKTKQMKENFTGNLHFLRRLSHGFTLSLNEWFPDLPLALRICFLVRLADQHLYSLHSRHICTALRAGIFFFNGWPNELFRRKRGARRKGGKRRRGKRGWKRMKMQRKRKWT